MPSRDTIIFSDILVFWYPRPRVAHGILSRTAVTYMCGTACLGGMHQPHLVEALEEAKRGADRERAQEKILSREKSRTKMAPSAAKEGGTCTGGDGTVASPSGSPGDEAACLRWATKKYLHGSISAEQFYEEMVGMHGTKTRVEEAFIAKVARGMPEDNAWALMEAHRKWRHEERLSKKRFRKMRRKDGISRRKAKKGGARAEGGESDDR